LSVKLSYYLSILDQLDNSYTFDDEFSCKGGDTWGPLNLFGGINKGRPDEEDLAGARAFAQGLKNKI